MNLTFKQINSTFVLLGILLSLSAFTHLWNPVGFPDIFFDEGVYMRRVMHLLDGLGPQEAYFHDHPFFGQLFLAGTLSLTGYPDSLNPTHDIRSIESLYEVPRILMGILAVLDTFLIYKIAVNRYNRNIAVVSSLLFAVMPITWLLRRILLDSILLPFLLSSILLALYSKDSKNKNLLILFSGILLGLAIFTKIPAFTMIPLIAGIVYSNNRRNLKTLGMWFIPVILLPLAWPAQSILDGQFDLWLKDVIWQTQRHSDGLASISAVFFLIDPVLFILGAIGLAFAAVKKDFFMLIWFVPFVIFLSLIGYTQYFHWIMILPVFCIASAIMIVDLSKKISKKKLQQILPPIMIAGVGIFGLASTTMLITTNVSSSQFEVISFVLQSVQKDDDITILASPTYSWIFSDVFDKENVLKDYSIILFGSIPTEKVLLVADPHFMLDIGRGKQLQDVYNATTTIKTFEGSVLNYDLFKYPYTSMRVNYESSHIEVKVNK